MRFANARLPAIEDATPRRCCASSPGAAGCQAAVVEPGDRMLVWCDGGPAIGRAVSFPPPFELDADGGVYVLVDDEPIETWRYEFVADGS
jgi:hypothetical protein